MQTYVCFVSGADTPVYQVSWCRLDTPVQLLFSCRCMFALFQGQTYLCTQHHDAKDLTHLCSCYCADMFALLLGQTHVYLVSWCRLDTPVQLLLSCRGIFALFQGKTHLCICYYHGDLCLLFCSGRHTPVRLLLSCRPMFAFLQGQTHLCTRCHDADRKIWHTCAAVIIMQTHLLCCRGRHTCVPGIAALQHQVPQRGVPVRPHCAEVGLMLGALPPACVQHQHSQRHTQTPSTGLQHPSSNHCRNWLFHRSQ